MATKTERIELARRAGSVTSEVKAANSRINGRRGGRRPEWLRQLGRDIRKEFGIDRVNMAAMNRMIYQAWKNSNNQ